MAIKYCAVISSFSTKRLLNTFCRIIKNFYPFWSDVYFLTSFSISSTWLCARPNSHEHSSRYNLDIFIPIGLSINLRFWSMGYTHWVLIYSFLSLQQLHLINDTFWNLKYFCSYSGTPISSRLKYLESFSSVRDFFFFFSYSPLR